METNKTPSEIEITFCVDACGNGWIIDGAHQWKAVDMIDGCGFDDNGIGLPKDIDSGVYKGKLNYSSYQSYEGEWDSNIGLSEIEEYLPKLTPTCLNNHKQQIYRLEKRIAQLEPEENFISVSGNKGFGGEHLEIRKVNDTTIHLKIGHCCLYMADMEIPCEAFTGLLANLINEADTLPNLIKRNLPWKDETNQLIMDKLNAK